ncbi:MAG: 23S rRNA (adenine(2503)-C(2))-methyltransferase RlmN [Phycisphaeraceae bacterium]|nr:23S rRNA (adenine(2503)-C(2))-methyltransferase RlmN [Phycisphaeraceae bacterium]
MIPPTNHIFEHTPATLALWCESVGMPAYRAKQILEWVYQRGVTNPAAMTNLSKADRDKAAAGLVFLSGRVVRHQRATDGTQKLLVQWETDASLRDVGPEAPLDVRDARAGDEAGSPPLLPILGQHDSAGVNTDLDSTRQTECVMIPSDDRKTACISSQVGCPVGCKFCASGIGGLDANLSAGRIVEQVYRLGRLMGVGRISNVVFMGMGEPLSNLGAVVPAIRTIASPDGLGISARKITVSTVGLPRAIENLASQLDLPITLALSLHAPTDELRRELIPWAEFTTIKDLLGACEAWFRRTGREVTLEYTLLRGVNDRPEHARQLASLARTLRANINLIRYNEVSGTPFQRPVTEDVLAFQKALRDARVNAHIRASRGRDIAAACGQLRHESAGRDA